MKDLDRDRIVRLLKQLGEPDDQVVLAAAREVKDLVASAGLEWDDVLKAGAGNSETPTTLSSDPIDNDAVAVIERLLARSDLSELTRDELSGYKDDIAEGEFTDDDRRYLLALEARL